jgi:protein-S-isoprenylcysteine O-methyltransferase Ste14
MYNGVLAVLLGEAWLFRSTAMLEYAAAVFVAFHLVVIVYEEPRLESQFGESYRAYRRAVPRWGFTVHPFAESRQST